MIDAEKFRNMPTGSKDGGPYYFARPLPDPWICRLRDAWEVLVGQAVAVKLRL